MSDLQPKGISITIGGVERHLLFTLAAVDEIQAEYGEPVSEVIRMMADDEQVSAVAFRLIYILVNDEIARQRHFDGSDEALITEQELKWMITIHDIPDLVGAILQAYGISLPETEEDEDPNAMSRSN